MSAFVRVAGHANLADGRQLSWVVADGRRGRRWRATTRAGSLWSALLLEVGVDGRMTRLELATESGLLTLHPEASGGLHGNVVTVDGVRHLAFAWGPEHELEIDGLAIATAVSVRRLAGSLAVGEGRALPVVAVARDLAVREATCRFERVTGTTWRINGAALASDIDMDERGIPIWGGDADEWPLELESAG